MSYKYLTTFERTRIEILTSNSKCVILYFVNLPHYIRIKKVSSGYLIVLGLIVLFRMLSVHYKWRLPRRHISDEKSAVKSKH